MSEKQTDQSKGLPMTAKWDPEKLAKEKAELVALEKLPFGQRFFGYLKRSGPGLLQSAMTLGAGSAAASVVAGASFGYKLLWVQPLAMFLGVMMLSALGKIVLTTGERPYRAFMRELSVTLVFLWAFGTILASVVWHFPQYGLAAGATRTLVHEFTGHQMETTKDKLDEQGAPIIDAKTGQPVQVLDEITRDGKRVSFLTGFAILGISCLVVFNYGSGSRGIKIYEWFLRGVIALIIFMFALVVAINITKINWIELGKGFIGWYGIPSNDPKAITMVLGMLGAAVGINMTFLYPYSLLAKGWGKEHIPLSRWDLGLSMFLPFALVTSLIMVGMTVTGIYDGSDTVNTSITPLKAADSITGVLGNKLGRLIFCLGLIGMTCSAISTHMVVCGFTMCEMLGLEYTKTRFRLFSLTPAIGIFGVVFTLPLWFPVAASAICLTMLPVAYLIFLILVNKRSYIGDAVGKGFSRFAYNAVLVVALVVASIGAFIQVKARAYDVIVDKLFAKQAVGEKPEAGGSAPAPLPNPESVENAEPSKADDSTK